MARSGPVAAGPPAAAEPGRGGTFTRCSGRGLPLAPATRVARLGSDILPRVHRAASSAAVTSRPATPAPAPPASRLACPPAPGGPSGAGEGGPGRAAPSASYLCGKMPLLRDSPDPPPRSPSPPSKRRGPANKGPRGGCRRRPSYYFFLRDCDSDSLVHRRREFGRRRGGGWGDARLPRGSRRGGLPDERRGLDPDDFDRRGLELAE